MAKKQKEAKTRITIKNKDLKELKMMCKEKNATLNDLFNNLVLYQDLTEQVLSFPTEMSENMALMQLTIKNKLRLWIGNIHDNFEDIKKGRDIKEIPKVDNIPSLIIGAGPSVYKNKHLELLAEKKFKGHIFATDAILKDCLEAGVVPDYVLFIDASEKIRKFIDHAIVDEYKDVLKAIMPVTVHPSVVERWNGEIYWCLIYMEELFAPNVSHIVQMLTKKTALTSAGQCGSLGWNLGAFTGYNPIVLIGLDLSFPADMPVEETSAGKYYLKELHADKETVLGLFENHYHHTFFNTDCYFEFIFKGYTESAKLQFLHTKELGVKIINCTEGGTLEGEGIDCMWFEDYLNVQKK